MSDRIVIVRRKDNPEVNYYQYESEQEALDRVIQENSDMEVKNMFQTDNDLYILFTNKSDLLSRLKELFDSFFREGDTKIW